MKHINKFLIALCCLFIANCSFAQTSENVDKCLEPEFTNGCFRTINHVFDDYVYLKSRPFSSKYSTDMFLVVNLKRNILYLITVCDGNDNNPMTVDFYDNNEKLLASSYDEKKKLNKKYITFLPEVAGKYLIKVTFKNQIISCSSVSYGMISKNIDSYISNEKTLK